MTVILTGFMGTGKTTVGKHLAREIGLPFIDTDKEVERVEGRPIAAIFAVDGENHFRAVERRVIEEAVSKEAVIATGGGAIVDPLNCERMRAAGPVICLVADPEVIYQRTAHNQERPLLHGDDSLQRIRQLLAARSEAYARADLTIDTTQLAIDSIVEQIVAFLRKNDPVRDTQ